MSVQRRNTSKGETTVYHYRFMHKGKDYSGVCEKCTDKASALKFEKEVREKVKKGSNAETAKELYEVMRKDLIGDKTINLSEAFELASKKPRNRYPSEKALKQKESQWRDLLSFMNDKYPQVTKLSEVDTSHAEEYIYYIQTHGRWNKSISYTVGKKNKTYQINSETVSARTSNYRLMAIKEVFTKLFVDAGLHVNPFAHIQKLTSDEHDRDIFTEDELMLIKNNPDDFCTPLFTIGAMTALRLGDVCTLKWDEIDFEFSVIKKILRKTRHKKNVTEIPILGTVYNYLKELKINAENEYVLPEQAKMYLNNPYGVSWRIKKYLHKLGIETSKHVDGRSRKVACKDFHSLRHTFCYLAGIQRIPLSVVQSIVGHMTPAMTNHYTRHAKREDRIKAMRKMPEFLNMSTALPASVQEAERLELSELVQNLPIKKIRELLKSARR